MRKIIASAVSGTLIATALMATPTIAAVGRAPVGGITFGRCEEAFLRKAHARCGFLSVPLDYDDPTGTQIRLAVSRVRHTTSDADYQGIMLVNPGGPGGSGIAWAALGQYVPRQAGDAYDWIGFDPRGVGSSEPSISCDPDYLRGPRPPYVPETDELEATWLMRSEGYANACEEDAGTLLTHMTTVDAARDMESIRVALGAQQINFYGYSYGTYLGQVYATLFPGNVRRMVLDSNVDPASVWYRANLAQDVALERVMRIWFGWLAKYRRVYHVGRTMEAVQRRFYSTQGSLDRKPAGGVVGSAEWNDTFLLAGYAQFSWTYLGDVFSAWVHEHDARSLKRAYRYAVGPGDDNGYAVYLAVTCTDAPSPTSWDIWREDSWATYEEARYVTWANTWFNTPCLYWPAPARVPTSVDGGGTKALIIDETLDAATPYEGSLAVRELFPASSLIAVVGGTTHGASLNGNPCVDDWVARFLDTGDLPPRNPGGEADLTCQPLPRPVPEQAAGAARSDPSIPTRLGSLAWLSR
jgi:pimeloyl-ACP methyl ester carboxylesterase